MQRHFLHTYYFDHPPILDEEGAVFDSVAAAKKEAGLGLWDTVSASMLDHARPVPMKIAVVDEAGNELDSVHAKELVPLQLRA